MKTRGIKNTYIYWSLIFLSSSIIYSSCAVQSQPEGGPKDLLPPTLVKQLPELGRTHFAGSSVQAEFDEYIQEKGLRAGLVSNPEIEGLRYKIRGKSIELFWEGELRPNTTYRIDCGNHIGDLNENNEYPHLEFVWSTGGTIDSLSVLAQVRASDASTDLSSLSVGLFDLPLDSNLTPAFVTRADKEGRAALNYLPSRTMALIAFEDLNFNRRLDTAGERVAWGDTLRPYSDTSRIVQLDFQDLRFDVPVADTLVQDSLAALVDTLTSKDLAELTLVFPPLDYGLILYLQNEKLPVFQQFALEPSQDSQRVNVPKIVPGNYQLTGYFDLNRNTRWDAFKWNTKSPAEPLLPVQSAALKAQWEVEVIVSLKAEDETEKEQ